MGSYLSSPFDDDNGLEAADDYHPSPDDVFAVRRFLLELIPAELANIILDDAEYWPRIIAVNEKPIDVPSGDGTGQLYIVTPPIPRPTDLGSDEDGVVVKPRMVRFHLKSCDQGWVMGGDPGLANPYHASWTWFEAVIFRPHRDATQMLQPPRSDLERIVLEETPHAPGERQLEPWGLLQVSNPINGSNSWHLQRNVRASSAIKEHEVVWRDDDDVDEENVSDFDLNTGCSKGAGFIRSLASGDIVGILIKALYPGWKNCVRGAQIEIFYSV